MNHYDLAYSKAGLRTGAARTLGLTLLAAAVLVASGCGKQEKKPGQALASVNGEEITMLQLNEELQRSGAGAAQQQQASKQLLESLIDRQLVQNEAVKDGLDRDPKVVQAIERAKALILVQSYLQKKVGTVAKPTTEEVAAYYQAHPEVFAHRRVFEMRQLVLTTASLDGSVKAAIDSAKSLDEVAAYLDSHNVKYNRTQLARSSTDLPPELAKRLAEMNKGQLFIVREGERSLINVVADSREAPVALEAAAPQIGQYLLNEKNKTVASAEIARLRGAAKIEYLTALGGSAAAPAASAPAAAKPAASGDDAAARGAAGLR